MVVAMLERNPDDEQTNMLARLVEERGYTRAELAFAAKELLYDGVLDKKLSFPGGKLSASDFERHVKRLRVLRARLEMPLKLDDVNVLIGDFPEWLCWDDFGITDYTAVDTPMYRYSFAGQVASREARPVINQSERPGADRTDKGGTYSLGDLL